MVRNVLLGTFLSGLRQLRRLANWVYPRSRGPVWRLWQLRCPWKTHRRTPNTEGPTFG